MNSNFQNILKQECSNYAQHYGCTELRHVVGSPFQTCEINGKKTALYPIARKKNELWTYNDNLLERYMSEYQNSHQVILIEVSLNQKNNVEDVKYIIMYDKIG